MNRFLEKTYAHQGNKRQIKGRLAMFCVQWKLVHIIATSEMHSVPHRPRPDPFLSFRTALMNWKGHDICEKLQKKWNGKPPQFQGRLLHKRLWECQSRVGCCSASCGWHGGDLTAVFFFRNYFPVAFLSKPQGLVTPKKKGNGNKRRKGKGLGKKRDPCLRKYRDFCIHGECKYIRELRAPSCM